jgi:MsuE subfamily FMN reductase
MKLVGIVGSAARSGRTRRAVELAAQAAREALPALELDVMDLAELQLGFAGSATQPAQDDTAAVLERVATADMFLISSPIYRGTYTGALKNLLDLIPLESLEGKPVGLIATGATAHHYLAIDTGLRPVLAWFNAFVLPGSVYLEHHDYQDGQVTSARVRGELAELGTALAQSAQRLAGLEALPRSLAGRMRG